MSDQTAHADPDDPHPDDPHRDAPHPDDPDPGELDPDDADVDEPHDWSDEELGYGRVPSAEERAQCRLAARQARERWRCLPDEPLPEACAVGIGALGTFSRALRWHTGTPQREFAELTAVPGTTITRMERDDRADPRLSTLQRMVEACGLRLAVVDADGTQLSVPFGQDTFRDAADRMLPAHLPTYDPRGRDWWGHGLIGGPDPRYPEPARVHARRERRPRPRTGPSTTLSDDEQERSA